jgi:hypothetical protein
MVLHNLPVLIPPKKTHTHHAKKSPIRHGGRKYLLALNLLHGLHIDKSGLPFPGREVVVAVDRACGQGEVVGRGEHISEEGLGGGFVEIEDVYS